MPDKLTDSEIVKALERLIELTSKDMLISNKGVTYGNVLDLINRLQAENKRLRGENGSLESDVTTLNALIEIKNDTIDVQFKTVEKYQSLFKTAKTEAYKEAFEKVKDELRNIAKIDWQGQYYYLVGQALFDNLLKELVGEKDV